MTAKLDRFALELDTLLGLHPGPAPAPDNAVLQTASVLIGMDLGAGAAPQPELRARWISYTRTLNPQRITRQKPPILSQWLYARPTVRNALIILLALTLVAAGVGSYLNMRWHKVGEIWVDVRSHPDNSIETTFIRIPGEKPISLSEAKTSLGFEFRVPSWAPEGFILNEQVNIRQLSPKYLYAVWRSSGGGEPIQLSLHSRWYWVPGREKPLLGGESTWPVAPDSFEEVRVHGQAAVLVRGDWGWPMRGLSYEEGNLDSVPFEGSQVNWNEHKGLSLYWTDDETAYRLWTYNPDITVADLIRMAESAK